MRLHRDGGRCAMVLFRMQVEVSNLLVVLIAIALILMVVREHIEDVRLRVLTINPAGYFVLRMCHILDKVLN